MSPSDRADTHRPSSPVVHAGLTGDVSVVVGSLHETGDARLGADAPSRA